MDAADRTPSANKRGLPRPYRRSMSISSFNRQDSLRREKPAAGSSASGALSRQQKSGSSTALNQRRPASSVPVKSTTTARLTQSRQSTISLSEQGLKVTHPPSSAPRIKARLVQDKTYYLDLLREKIRSSKMEISRLASETVQFDREYENQVTMSETATLLAEQIQDLRKALANYNFLLDKQNTRASLADVLQECAAVESSNNESAQEVDQIYEESRNKERQLADAEQTLLQLKSLSDTILVNMDEEAKVRYYTLLQKKAELENRIEGQSTECQRLNENIGKLESEMHLDGANMDALKLFSDLVQMNNERARLRAESEERGSPQEQREKLLSDMKQDNKDIQSMKEQMEEVRREIDVLKAEKQAFRGKDLERTTSNRHRAEKEIRRSSQLCASEREAIAKLKLSIKSLEEALASVTVRSEPDVCTPYDKHLNEYLRVLTTLKKQRNTASAYNKEIGVIEGKMESLKEDLGQYSRLNEAQMDAEQRSHECMARKAALQKQIDESVRLLGEVESRRSSLDRRINQNEQMRKIISIERSLRSFKKENASLQTELKSYTTPDSLQDVKEAVLKSITDYNALLVRKQTSLPRS